MQGRIVSYVTYYKKEKTMQFQKASQVLRQAQHTYQQSPTSPNRLFWLQAKEHLDYCQESYEQVKTNYASLRLHKFGNKAGKLLSHLTKGPQLLVNISSHWDSSGNVQSSSTRINQAFRDFYMSPYSKDRVDSNAASAFLKDIPPSRLTQEHLDTIHAPLSGEEIKLTISSLSNSKFPGPDVYSAEYYKMLKDKIIPQLLNLYNDMWSSGP